jgi:hypothetical protein
MAVRQVYADDFVAGVLGEWRLQNGQKAQGLALVEYSPLGAGPQGQGLLPGTANCVTLQFVAIVGDHLADAARLGEARRLGD